MEGMTRLSLGQVATRLGITSGCVLDYADEAGISRFWCCEELFDFREIGAHLDFHAGFRDEIELEATDAQLDRLAELLGIDREDFER